MSRRSVRVLLAALLCSAMPQVSWAQGFPEIELTAEQSTELAALRAAADPDSKYSDPAAYKAAYERVLAYARTLYPEPHPELERIKAEILFADFMLGNSAGLRAAMRQAIAVYEAAGPAYRANLIESYNNLAVINEIMGHPAEAIAPMEKAIAMWREDAPPEGSHVLGQGLSNLAQLERALGQYEAALAHNAEAIAMLEPIHAADPANAEKADALAVALSNRVLYLKDLDRIQEALAASREAVVRIAGIVGADAPRTAVVLVNAAILLTNEGKYAEAEPLARRAVAIREAAFGPESSSTAEAYLALTAVLSARGRHAEGLPMLEHAYRVLRREFGDAAPQTLEGKGKLGRFYFALGDQARGIAEMREMLATIEAGKVPWHRDVVENQELLARLLARAGRWGEVIALLDRAEAAQRGTPAENWTSFLALQALRALAEAELGQGGSAIERLNQIMPGIEQRWLEELEREGTRGARDREIDNAVGWAALAAFEAGDMARGFAIAQRLGLGPSERAVLRVRQRRLAGDPAIAAALHNWHDLLERRSQEQTRFEQAAAAGDDTAAAAHVRLLELNGAIAALAPTLGRTSFEPVALAQIQSRLAPGEAALLAFETELGTRLVAVAADRAVPDWAGLPTEDLRRLVAAVRDRLDLGLVAGVPFETVETDALHAALFTPEIERVLAGKRRIAVIAKGELAKLPFALLTRTRADGSREWAIERFAFSYPVLLAGIAQPAAVSARLARFVGIGAPALPDAGQEGQGARLAFRGTGNARAIAQLGALSQARAELEGMARALQSRSRRILAGPQATEAALRALDLGHADIISFATHGLMAGELDGLREAALVLSPPLPGEAEGPDNDGLLTTSEIAALDLRARWVVLSACNSASGDSEDGEALGGLARAFLYAGARTLLVSHWRVRDDAAARLTVSAARATAAGLDPAEALRRAQLALMSDGSVPGAAHPALWAPFVLVGN